MSLLDAWVTSTGSPTAMALFNQSMRTGPLCSSTLPTSPWRLADIFEGAHGDQHALLAAYSATPLHLLTMSPEQGQRITNRLATGRGATSKCLRLGPLTQCGNRYGLVCPACRQEARSETEFRVSLVAHAFDFMTRCPRHGCLLVSDQPCSAFEMQLCEVGSSGARKNAMEYARAVKRFLDCGPHEPLWTVVRRELLKKGFILESGRYRRAALDSAFKKYFAAGFEDVRLTWLVRDCNVVEICVRTVERGRGLHPVLAILIWMFATGVDGLSRVRPLSSEYSYSPSKDAKELNIRRVEWMLHMEKNPELTRNQLRFTLVGTWTWLYRHDRSWLDEHQVAPAVRSGGHPPAALPPPVLDAIRYSSTDFRPCSGGREPVPSAYQARLGYGMSRYTFNRVAAVSGAFGATAQLPARREVFVTRRVQRAINELANNSSSLDVVAHAARLRADTVDRFYQPF
ncbi:hypothetical protein A9R05_21265 [Burkholderia sp. KK1]|nr:hypothetical protein A9R05_21265 [Burkholderia sp. KK1]